MLGAKRAVQLGCTSDLQRRRAPVSTSRLFKLLLLDSLVNELYADVFGKTYGLQSIGLRYFNVFGPRQDPNGAYAAVIPKWISSMIRNEPIFINGDGETSRLGYAPTQRIGQGLEMAMPWYIGQE